MAVIRKVTRVSNPRGRKYRRAKGVRNAKGRFVKRTRNKRGTKRKRNISLTSLTSEIKRLKSRILGGGTRRKRHSKKRAHRRQNPVLIELGSMVNPKRRKNVAKTRKRRKTRNPRRHARKASVTPRRRRRYTRRRRHNPVPAWAPAKGYRRRRATNSRRRRVHHRRRHRNPAIFGRSGGKDLLMMMGGGLIGVAATKYLPTLLPASITSTISGATGSFFPVLITGAGAFAAGYLAKRFAGEVFGNAVLFGGLMQTGSALLNAFFPTASILGQRLALSGVGDIVPGQFVVPQNPFKYSLPAGGTGNGMGNLRRFGTFR